jgi:hypothetical protein
VPCKFQRGCTLQHLAIQTHISSDGSGGGGGVDFVVWFNLVDVSVSARMECCWCWCLRENYKRIRISFDLHGP